LMDSVKIPTNEPRLMKKADKRANANSMMF
jgi:hypothetical protein